MSAPTDRSGIELSAARKALRDTAALIHGLNWDAIRKSEYANPTVNYFLQTLVQPTLEDFFKYVSTESLTSARSPEGVFVDRRVGRAVKALLNDLQRYAAGNWPLDNGDTAETHRDKQLSAFVDRVAEIRAALEPLGSIWRAEIADGLVQLAQVRERVSADAQALSNLRATVSGAKEALEATARETEEAREKAARAQLEALTSKLTETEKVLRDRTESVMRLEVQLSELVKETTELAKVAKMKKQARHYGNTARWYGWQSLAWIGASLAVAVTMIVLVHWSITEGKGPPAPYEAITVAANLAHFTARALGVTVLSFALATCVRNFRAAKHNQATNQHRAEALETFEELNNIADEKMKEILFTQATLAIFTAQPTGYTDPSAGATHLHELASMVGLGKPSKSGDETSPAGRGSSARG